MIPGRPPARAADAQVHGIPTRRSRWPIVVAAGLVVTADQLTKMWALRALSAGPLPVVGPLQLRLLRNTAAAFSLGGAAVPFLALGATAFILVMIARNPATGAPGTNLALGLLVGGALGNIADRLLRAPGLLRGAVIDFVDLGFWPVFNLADAAITIGCATLVVLSFRADRADRAGPVDGPADL